MDVFLRLAAIDQVACHDDDVGQRIELEDMRDRALEIARGVDAVVEKLAGALDVRVGKLRDQHDQPLKPLTIG
jgi:hypothetical protein